MAESTALKNVSILVGIVASLVGIFIALAQYLDSSGKSTVTGSSPPPVVGGATETVANRCGATAPAEITLSNGHAARGAKVTVYGRCFQPGERVQLRVHVADVGSATADGDGSFTQTITIPDSAPPAGFPTDVSATGRTSIKTGTAPFETT